MRKWKLYMLTTAFIAALFITSIPAVIPAAVASDGWTLVYDARSMKGYPDLKEYVWQKNATMEPHGIYDVIGLHRLVKTGVQLKGVIFICPRQLWAGEQFISNPPTDNYTKTENDTQAIYWANRGFDVYAVDFRPHNVPKTLNTSQLSFMQTWGYDMIVSDAKEAVDKAKEISKSSKVFIAGISNGGGVALAYATKYWQQDVLGIVLIDGQIFDGRQPVVAKLGNETNTYNLTDAVSKMIATGNWSLSNVANANMAKYALNNPGAPAQYPPGTPLSPAVNPLTNKTWTNITDWYAAGLSISSFYSNVLEGYGNVTSVLRHISEMDWYFPVKAVLDTNAIVDWVNCPYLPFDYDDHFKDINVPVLAFASGLYSNRTGKFQFVNGMATKDFTGIMLPKYGGIDVYMGTYSARDVSQPALTWMLGELAGLKATAFCDVTVLSGWNWLFFTHSQGGTGAYTYQWYEGTTLLQGQTSMLLSVTKNTPGIYTFYCKVADSEGSTAYSNTVTLTVR